MARHVDEKTGERMLVLSEQTAAATFATRDLLIEKGVITYSDWYAKYSAHCAKFGVEP